MRITDLLKKQSIALSVSVKDKSEAIDTLVDPIPYVSKVENTTASSGGVDIESDDSLTERIYLAPSQFSSAGPRDAYEYYTKEWRADIADAKVVSPDPCEIQIYAVTDQGALLNSTDRAALLAYLSAAWSSRPHPGQPACS